MPGILPHLIAGGGMFITGRYYFKSYFDGDNKTKERLLLAVVCLSFGLLPDVFLGIYYMAHVLPLEVLLSYHNFTQLILLPLTIVLLLILTYRIDIKNGPVWIMGLWSILLHILMDFYIPGFNMWI